MTFWLMKIYTDDACYRYHQERAMIQLRHFISVLGSRPSAYVTGAVERTVLREQSPMRLIHIAMKVLLHIMFDHLNFNLHSYCSKLVPPKCPNHSKSMVGMAQSNGWCWVEKGLWWAPFQVFFRDAANPGISFGGPYIAGLSSHLPSWVRTGCKCEFNCAFGTFGTVWPWKTWWQVGSCLWKVWCMVQGKLKQTQNSDYIHWWFFLAILWNDVPRLKKRAYKL